MAYSCPDCGSPLSVVSDRAGRTLVCPSCQGRLYGLSPFERMLSDGVGVRVWTGAAEGSSGGPCPYCSVPMHHPDGDPDAPRGLGVCRTCQEIWVPEAAREWMAANGAGGPAMASAEMAAPPAECSNCGAPYQPDEDGRCHWCHAQIGAPQPVVVLMQPEPVPDLGFRLF
jgi:DNA-directed RNA polymerase subunit RPC12/RpoP